MGLARTLGSLDWGLGWDARETVPPALKGTLGSLDGARWDSFSRLAPPAFGPDGTLSILDLDGPLVRP